MEPRSIGRTSGQRMTSATMNVAIEATVARRT
jgi:hypothetical protein